MPQTPHQVFILFLFRGKLAVFLALGREHDNLAVAGAAGSSHALNGANDIHDVKEKNEIDARNVETFLTDGRGDEGVERPRAKCIERRLLFLLRLPLGASTFTRRRAFLPAGGGIALSDKLGNFNLTRRIRARGNLPERAHDILDAFSVRRKDDHPRIRRRLFKVLLQDGRETVEFRRVMRPVGRHRSQQIDEFLGHGVLPVNQRRVSHFPALFNVLVCVFGTKLEE